jgi:hypothetical protein
VTLFCYCMSTNLISNCVQVLADEPLKENVRFLLRKVFLTLSHFGIIFCFDVPFPMILMQKECGSKFFQNAIDVSSKFDSQYTYFLTFSAIQHSHLGLGYPCNSFLVYNDRSRLSELPQKEDTNRILMLHASAAI